MRTTISSKCQRSLGRGPTLPQPSRDRGTELQHPASHRFVGDFEPAFGQQFLDIAIAQGEAEIQPDRVLDELGREAMAAVAERNHADILSDASLAPDPVSVTMPAAEMVLADDNFASITAAVIEGRTVKGAPSTTTLRRPFSSC
jgi:hypothetical protein